MLSSKKHVKIGNTKVYDTVLICSRVMGLQMSGRDIDIKNVVQHELAPIPTALFDESGNLRITKTKSTLKKKLQVEKSRQTVEMEQHTKALVLDGCEILCVVHYPSSGCVKDYVNGFVRNIIQHLSSQDVYLVFDRYDDYSIKSSTRSARSGKQPSQHHQLTLDTHLPPRHVLFNVTFNKVQLIAMITTELTHVVQGRQQVNDDTKVTNSLVVTFADPTPLEVSHGMIIPRDEMKTTHEEVDVIMVQQMVMLSS